MTSTAEWHDACGLDGELAALATASTVVFSVEARKQAVTPRTFSFVDGVFTGDGGEQEPAFALLATPHAWDEFFAAVPRPWYQSYFGMLMRVPGTLVDGSELAFAQHAHVVRRVLEIGREVFHGSESDAADDLGALAVGDPGAIVTQAVDLEVCGSRSRVSWREAGAGRDVLLLHTAGSDARQFDRLMADPRLARSCHLVAFDLPGHGRSTPSVGVLPGAYRLTTDQYAETVLAFLDAVGLDRPVVVGASMAGQICLELALPRRIGSVASSRVRPRTTCPGDTSHGRCTRR